MRFNEAIGARKIRRGLDGMVIDGPLEILEDVCRRLVLRCSELTNWELNCTMAGHDVLAADHSCKRRSKMHYRKLSYSLMSQMS